MSFKFENVAEYIHWFRGNPEFPRAVLELPNYRYTVNDEIEFIGYIEGQEGKDCYTQVFSKRQFENNEFDTIYFDVDEHDESLPYRATIENAHSKFKHVYEKIVQSGVVPSRCYFTGRGFSIYLDFIELKFNNRDEYKNAVKQYINYIKIADLLDNSVIGDSNRVARVPGTLNSKTNNMYCIRIDPSWPIDLILENSSKNIHYKQGFCRDIELGRKLKEILVLGNCDCGIKCEDDIIRKPIFGELTEYKDLPQCMKNFYNEIVYEGELDHYERVNFAIFFMKAWGFERTKQLISNANDYKEGMTEYQLNYLKNRNMNMYSCKRLQTEGMCPFANMKDCPCYNKSSGWLERLLPRYKEKE